MSWWSTAPTATSVTKAPAYVTHTEFKEGDPPPTFPSTPYKKPPTLYNPTTLKKIPGKKPPTFYNPKTLKQLTPNTTTTLYKQSLQSQPPSLNEINQSNTNAQYLRSDSEQMEQMTKEGLTFGGRKSKKRGNTNKRRKMNGGKKSKKRGNTNKRRKTNKRR